MKLFPRALLSLSLLASFTFAYAGKIDQTSNAALSEARPDVVNYIKKTYADPMQRAAAIQYGSALVYAINNPQRQGGLKHSVGYLSSRSQVCLSWRFGADPQAAADVRAKVREQVLNTEARRNAYKTFYASYDGVISHQVARGACNTA